MSISDRLDEIDARLNYEGIMDEDADYRAPCMDAPDMLAALRDVLDLHPKGIARAVAGTAGRDIEHCLGCRGAHGIAHDEHGLVPWPCPPVRAIANALGEEA